MQTFFKKLRNLAIVEVKEILFAMQTYMENVNKCVKKYMLKFQAVYEKLTKYPTAATLCSTLALKILGKRWTGGPCLWSLQHSPRRKTPLSFGLSGFRR